MRSSGPSRPPQEFLVAAVEALIFASDEPVPPVEIAQAFGRMDVAPEYGGLGLRTVDQVAVWDRQDFAATLERVAVWEKG
mgnify:CR=1 FL=1